MARNRSGIAEVVGAAERTSGAQVGTDPDTLRFDKQREFSRDPAKAKAAICGRRAGKTFGHIYDFAEGMQRHSNSSFVFVEKTAKAAKNKLWRPFRRRNLENKWGFEFKEADKEVHAPNGSVLYLAGADKADELDKVRGLEKIQRAVIDECGTQKPMNLEYMAEDVLEPALMDTDGELVLSGTPGPVLIGYWYEVSTGKRPGWSIHGWDARENPHMRAAEYFERILTRRKWERDNPRFVREYLGKWVRDLIGKVFAFDPDRNVVPGRPEMGKGWTTILSMDFGVVHSVAWVVLAYGPYGKTVYVLYSNKKPGQSPTEAAIETQRVCAVYKPDIIIGDTGGMGKAYATEFTKHYDIPMVAADKQEKRASLEFTSDAMKSGLLVSHDGNQTLHEELEGLQWDEFHKDIAPGQDDHESEALVYGFKLCPAYANLKDDPPSRETDGLPPWVDRDDDEDEPEEKHFGEVEDW